MAVTMSSANLTDVVAVAMEHTGANIVRLLLKMVTLSLKRREHFVRI
jgi:hypothetical protein